jgi:HD-GYP domain-containing protein (c-di-GMP phosphodiesterase class II)
MVEFMQEFRVSARGLRVGMFVSRLDRPWLDTRFPLQGFLIRTEDELAMLQNQCSHAYVDIARGESPDPRHIELGETPLVDAAREREEYEALRKTRWDVSSDFEDELAHAEDAHELLEKGIAEFMEDLGSGRRGQIDRLRRGVESMVESITRNPSAFRWLKELKRRDDYTYQHAMSCSVWAATFGRHLGMEKDEICELALGGLLFDVGKTRVPPALLTKQAVLDEVECGQMREHVRHSLDILADLPGLSPAMLEMVATHHERHDGSGYPQGLQGNAIPIAGRILGLVDTYDALTTQRAHAPGLAPHEAVAELYRARGGLFQTELVEQFIQACGIYPTGSLVELSDGYVGVVTAVHSLKRLRPSVMLLLDPERRPLPQFRTIDLSDAQGAESQAGISIAKGLPRGAYGIDPAELFLD